MRFGKWLKIDLLKRKWGVAQLITLVKCKRILCLCLYLADYWQKLKHSLSIGKETEQPFLPYNVPWSCFDPDTNDLMVNVMIHQN